MKAISARNQLPGTVKSVSRGAVNAEIITVTDSGLEISSIITLGSCVRMNIQPGDAVTAVIKASDVIIAVGGDVQMSARNNITGVVAKIVRGAVSDEIVIDANGAELVSIITEASVKRLQLDEGVKVGALIKASNVMIMK